MENFCPTDEQLESLAEVLLPDIIEFYKDEKNKKMFEEWEIQQNKKKNGLHRNRPLRKGRSVHSFISFAWE